MTVRIAQSWSACHSRWSQPKPTSRITGLTTPMMGSSIRIQIIPVATADMITGRKMIAR
jgi:hypothetical protein